MHLTHVVSHVLLFDLQHACLDAWLTEVFNKRLALGHTLVGAEEQEEAFLLFLLVFGGNLLLRINEKLLAELTLCLDDNLYVGEELLEEVVVSLGNRP